MTFEKFKEVVEGFAIEERSPVKWFVKETRERRMNGKVLCCLSAEGEECGYSWEGRQDYSLDDFIEAKQYIRSYNKTINKYI